MNRALIETYKYIRDNLTELLADLNQIQVNYYSLQTIDHKSEFYYKKRSEFNALKEPSIHKSALFIFLNKTGFNGMYRENASGEYNIPFGKHDKPLICDDDNLVLVSEFLKDIEIKCGSYELAVVDAVAGDFVYLDPPYEPLNRTSQFTQYQAGGFTQDDQRKLRDMFQELSDRGCFVMMSNSTASLIKELYADFSINKVSVGRGINSKGLKRSKIEELIVTNYVPTKGQYLKAHSESHHA